MASQIQQLSTFYNTIYSSTITNTSTISTIFGLEYSTLLQEETAAMTSITGIHMEYSSIITDSEQLIFSVGGNPSSMTILPNGNVGIGISPPRSTLDVSGSASISQILTVARRIGINTNNPDVRFAIDVAGRAKFSNGLISGSTITTEGSNGHLQVVGRAVIGGGTITSNTLDVSGTANISQLLTVSSINVNGTANVNDDLTVTGYAKVSTLFVNEAGSGGTIFLGGGMSNDSGYDNSVIQTRQYTSANSESTEVLLYKGNDAPHDRIRLRAGRIVFDTYDADQTPIQGNELNRTNESIRMDIDNGGRIGVNVTAEQKTMFYVSTNRLYGNGVTTEAARFENGNFIARPLQTGNFYVGFVNQSNPATDLGNFRISNNGSSQHINIENTAGNMILENIMTLTGTNVGINTTPDSAFKLDVNGTARFATGVQITGDIIVKNGGRIGINLNGDPGADFAIDVSGVGNFTRGIVTSGNIIAENGANLQIAGNAAIGGVLTNNRLEVYGSAKVSTLFVNEEAAGGRIYLGGGVGDDAGYRNSIITTRQYDPVNNPLSSELLLYKGDNHIYTTGQLNQADRIRLRAGAIVFDTYSDPNGQWNLTEEQTLSTVNPRMVIDNLGRVGIGITDPGFLLDVNGRGKFKDGLEATGRVNINNDNDITGFMLDVSGTARVTQSLTVSTLYVNQPGSGGRIYLGGGSLDDSDYKNSVITTRTYNNANEQPTPFSTELLLYKGYDSGSDRIRLRAGAIVFDTYNTDQGNSEESNLNTVNARMVIDNGGNVGIGKYPDINSQYKLDVAGAVKVNASLLASSGILSLGNIIIEANAKVGINNANPYYLLDVSGTARVTNGIIGRISNYDIKVISTTQTITDTIKFKGMFILFKNATSNIIFNLPSTYSASMGAYYKVANLTTAYNITFKNSSNDNILILYPSQVAELIASDDTPVAGPGTWEILAP